MLSWMSEIFDKFADLLRTVLPTSPFREFINSFTVPTWVGWLNWFFPVTRILAIFAAWLVAYGLYLAYSIILRWVKAIE